MVRRPAVMALAATAFLASVAVLAAAFMSGPEDAVPAGDAAPPAVQVLAEGAGGEALAAPAVTTVEVVGGDTLADLLLAAGSDPVEADRAVDALAGLWDARRLQIGQHVHIALAESGEGARALTWFAVALDEGGYIVVRRHRAEDFLAARSEGLPGEALLLAAPEEHRSIAVHGLEARRGDTLMQLALRAGASRSDADRAIRALSRLVDPASLQIGQRLEVALAAAGGGPRLAALSLEGADGRFIVARRLAAGGYDAFPSDRPFAATEAPEGEEQEAVERAAASGLRVERSALRSGDTLMSLLLSAGAERGEAARAIAALRPHYDLRRLQIGRELRVVFASRAGGEALAVVAVAIGDGLYVQADLRDGAFVAARTETPVGTVPLPGAAPPELAASDSGEQEEATVAARQPQAEGEGAGTVALSPRAEQAWLIAGQGDTLAGLLRLLGGREDETARIVAALAGHGGLAAGRELVVVTDEDDRGLRIVALSIDREGGGMLAVWRRQDGSFAVREADSHVDLADFMPADGAAARVPGASHAHIEIPAGGTLAEGLLALGIDAVEVDRAIDSLNGVFDPRRIRAGQVVEVVHDAAGLAGFALTFAPGERVEVARDDDGFRARLVELPLLRRFAAASGRIESSLYQAALAAGVPPPVLAATIRAYSFDVDFQREIRTGDDFALLYEYFVDEAGHTVRHGAPLHAVLRLSGAPLPIYRFTLASGFGDYFNDRGESVRKELLRTPIDGARITSAYGMRTLFGYTRMHRGVDFGAPTGTPILAAGDGVVDYVGRNGAYGNYVRLRHNSTYQTAYAHMSRFASGLARGKRVRQGETIGYVGNSGRSTGPHLHYEVMVDGELIDPMSLRLPAGEILTGGELARFQGERERLDGLLASLLEEQLAAADPG